MSIGEAEPSSGEKERSQPLGSSCGSRAECLQGGPELPSLLREPDLAGVAVARLSAQGLRPDLRHPTRLPFREEGAETLAQAFPCYPFTSAPLLLPFSP